MSIKQQMFATFISGIEKHKISLDIIKDAIDSDKETAKNVAETMKKKGYIFYSTDLEQEIPFMSDSEFAEQSKYRIEEVCLFDGSLELKKFYD